MFGKKDKKNIVDDVENTLNNEIDEVKEIKEEDIVKDAEKEITKNIDGVKEEVKQEDATNAETIAKLGLTQEQFNQFMEKFQEQKDKEKNAVFAKDETLQGTIRLYNGNPIVNVFEHKENREIVNGIEKIIETIDIEYFDLESREKVRKTISLDEFTTVQLKNIKFKEKYDAVQKPLQPSETLGMKETEDGKAVISYNKDGERILIYQNVIINRKITTDDFGVEIEINPKALN